VATNRPRLTRPSAWRTATAALAPTERTELVSDGLHYEVINHMSETSLAKPSFVDCGDETSLAAQLVLGLADQHFEPP